MTAMKRYFITLMLILAAALPLSGSVVERTFITTDKDVYVAGDNVWISAFCVDAGSGLLSGASSVAYIELHNGTETVQDCKIALRKGRGAGSFTLNATLPTGNYRIVAYTALNKAEAGYDYEGIASKTISVFNTLSKERVKGGVKVISPEEYASLGNGTPESSSGGIDIAVGESESGSGFFPVRITNNGRSAASVSVSVYHEDGIRHPDNPAPADFAAALKQVRRSGTEPGAMPEYEGEVIRGRIVGAGEDLLDSLKGRYAFISAPGNGFDIYASRIADDGTVLFRTGNIYGTRDLICEIEGLDSSNVCHLELDDPFTRSVVPAAAPLAVSESVAPALKERSIAMQIERRFASDSLFWNYKVRSNTFLGADRIRYALDDFTRFPLMKEVFTEIVHEIKVSGNSRRGRTLSVGLMDAFGRVLPPSRESLILLDGVPVFENDKIYNYDPLLVKYIDIYPYVHVVGTRFYDGVVNFVTYKGNMPSMTFGGNVRIVNFKGVSFPRAYTCHTLLPGSGYPDYRQTVYWYPLAGIEPGGSFEDSVKIPDYPGTFTIVVEGFDEAGGPVRAKSSFVIK